MCQQNTTQLRRLLALVKELLWWNHYKTLRLIIFQNCSNSKHVKIQIQINSRWTFRKQILLSLSNIEMNESEELKQKCKGLLHKRYAGNWAHNQTKQSQFGCLNDYCSNCHTAFFFRDSTFWTLLADFLTFLTAEALVLEMSNIIAFTSAILRRCFQNHSKSRSLYTLKIFVGFCTSTTFYWLIWKWKIKKKYCYLSGL